MALFFCLAYIDVIAPEGVEVYKCLEKETKHSDMEHEGNLPSDFCVGTCIFLFVRSTAELCNHLELQGQEHTFLPLPSRQGYKMLLPGSTSSNMSLCGFKE